MNGIEKPYSLTLALFAKQKQQGQFPIQTPPRTYSNSIQTQPKLRAFFDPTY